MSAFLTSELVNLFYSQGKELVVQKVKQTGAMPLRLASRSATVMPVSGYFLRRPVFLTLVVCEEARGDRNLEEIGNQVLILLNGSDNKSARGRQSVDLCIGKLTVCLSAGFAEIFLQQKASERNSTEPKPLAASMFDQN